MVMPQRFRNSSSGHLIFLLYEGKRGLNRGPDKKGGKQLFSKQYLSYYPTKPYDVGTQKNRLNETIHLSTHIVGLCCLIKSLEHAKRPVSRALGG